MPEDDVTLEISVSLEESNQELLVVKLVDWGFEGFMQEASQLKAYGPVSCWSDAQAADLEQWLLDHNANPSIQVHHVIHQNWNAKWEASVTPVAAGSFLIKPTWAEVPEAYAHLEVVHIDPKMSFGTGHHESTRLILRHMSHWVNPGDKVLDAGTGTGILSIAALRLGASSVVAFDNDPWAQANVLENFVLNEVGTAAVFREGSIEVVPESGFDLILANINRNVLLDLMSQFADKLDIHGHLILAGLLITDRDLMLNAAQKVHFHPVDEAIEGTWWSIVFRYEGRNS